MISTKAASKYRDGGTNMAYYKNHRSPRFEKMSEVRQWLEGQEKIRHKGENIDHRDRKWSFEGNYLTVDMKVIEDPQAALHVGAGHLPDWLQNKKSLLELDMYDNNLCIFRSIAVHQGSHQRGPLESGDYGENGVFGENGRNGA